MSLLFGDHRRVLLTIAYKRLSISLASGASIDRARGTAPVGLGRGPAGRRPALPGLTASARARKRRARVCARRRRARAGGVAGGGGRKLALHSVARMPVRVPEYISERVLRASRRVDCRRRRRRSTLDLPRASFQVFFFY